MALLYYYEKHIVFLSEWSKSIIIQINLTKFSIEISSHN
jgi:hypothetical protein